jgi:hypothetical protein
VNALIVILSSIGGLVVLDVVALLWGADSRDSLESAEWERRRNWEGFRR